MEPSNEKKYRMIQVEPRRVGCRRSIRLKSASDIARLLGKTINEVLRGERDAESARTVGYLASVFAKALEVADIQKRLDVLEKVTEKARREFER